MTHTRLGSSNSRKLSSKLNYSEGGTVCGINLLYLWICIKKLISVMCLFMRIKCRSEHGVTVLGTSPEVLGMFYSISKISSLFLLVHCNNIIICCLSTEILNKAYFAKIDYVIC